MVRPRGCCVHAQHQHACVLTRARPQNLSHLQSLRFKTRGCILRRRPCTRTWRGCSSPQCVKHSRSETPAAGRHPSSHPRRLLSSASHERELPMAHATWRRPHVLAACTRRRAGSRRPQSTRREWLYRRDGSLPVTRAPPLRLSRAAASGRAGTPAPPALRPGTERHRAEAIMADEHKARARACCGGVRAPRCHVDRRRRWVAPPPARAARALRPSHAALLSNRLRAATWRVRAGARQHRIQRWPLPGRGGALLGRDCAGSEQPRAVQQPLRGPGTLRVFPDEDSRPLRASARAWRRAALRSGG